MSRHPLLPDELPNRDDVPRVLSRQQALTLGFSRHAIAHRLAARHWHLILPHVYLTGSTLTWFDRLDAALLLAGPDGLLTGAAALADLGVPCVRRPSRVLVLVPRTNRTRPAGWVRIRRTDRMPGRAPVPGPRRADPARAVADLALELRRPADVTTLVAQATRARLCTIAELRAELATGPRKYSANLRRALADVGGGAWSAPEAEAAALLRRAAVPPFEQNARIVLSTGQVVRPDFLWRELRAVLEIDSDEHHSLPGDRDRTDQRQIALTTDGYAVISRRPAAIARDPRRFQREVSAWLAARAIELGRRP